MKKSGSKITIISKQEQAEKGMRNRVSVKTEGSSKTHSVIKEEEKWKKVDPKKSKKGSTK